MSNLKSCFAAALASLIIAAAPAMSQESADAYPSRIITIIIPFASGGPADTETRIYINKLRNFLPQQAILDYKPGAGATIGTGYVAKATPDGYTLLQVTGTFTAFPILYKDLPFDPVKSFAPISLMSDRTTLLVVRSSFPAKNVKAYLAYAKANPGKINFGTTGPGGGAHLGGAWLADLTNTQVTFVHYKGGGPMVTDMLAGRLDAMLTTSVTAVPLLKSGKIVALGIGNNRRSKVLADIPTVAEQGVPEYNYSSWLGFIAPGGTPAPIVNKLSEAFAKVAKSSDVAGPLEADGLQLVGSTPEQFRQIIITETARWRKLAATGIKLEE